MLYFLIFCLNIGIFTYYSFLESKKDKNLFPILHETFISKTNVKKAIAKMPIPILIEESLICIYIPEFLDYFNLNNIHLLRIIFAISHLLNIKIIKNRNFVLMQFLHSYILSYITLSNTPLLSLFIHFLNNLVVCILRYYLHNNYFESPMARLLDEELRKLKDKKLVTNPITNWFPQEDNITTPKSKSE